MVEFQITSTHAIPSTGIISIIYPSQLGKLGTFGCTFPAVANCLIVSESERKIIVRDAFPTGLTANSRIIIRIQGLTNSKSSNTTSSFRLYSFTSELNGFKINKVESGLTLTSSCDYPCETCPDSDKSVCDSCV